MTKDREPLPGETGVVIDLTERLLWSDGRGASSDWRPRVVQPLHGGAGPEEADAGASERREDGAVMVTEEQVERAVIEAFRAVFKRWKREEK